MQNTINYDEEVEITADDIFLQGKLIIPEDCSHLVMFISDRASSQDHRLTNYLAEELRKEGFGSLEFELLTPEEAANERKKMDINLLAERIIHARQWLQQNPNTETCSIGIFAYNTGTAAALLAASRINGNINAVVSVGGRPDLVLSELKKVKCPVLLIAGGADNANVTFNQKALPYIRSDSSFRVLQDAGHDFMQAGKKQELATMSRDWFIKNT
jgi:putative phosphoribosyl transferase